MQSSRPVDYRERGPAEEAIRIKGNDGSLESTEGRGAGEDGLSKSRIILQAKATADNPDRVWLGVSDLRPVECA